MKGILKYVLPFIAGFITSLLATYFMSGEMDYIGAFSTATIVLIAMHLALRIEMKQKTGKKKDPRN